MIKNALLAAALPLSILSMVACSGGGNMTGTGGSGGGGTGGAGTQGTVFGSLILKTFPESMYATLSGQFVDGPIPPTMPLVTSKTQSGCQLLTPTLCNPACPATSYCSNEAKCVPSPKPVNPGPITVTGLAGVTEPSTPTAPLFAYSFPTLQQPYPPCAEGSTFSIKSEKFMVSSKCIAPFVLTNALPIPVKSGQATHLTWTPPASGATSRVKIELEISHHGGYKGQINCDVPDTGSFDIPEPLVTGLVALGLAGYPSIDVERVSTGTASNEPGAQLTAQSGVLVEVDTGVKSCMGDSDCPSGMKCMNPGDHVCH